MNKQEIIEALQKMDFNGDQEILHGTADELLLAALDLAGMSDVAKAFRAARERVGFWYA